MLSHINTIYPKTSQYSQPSSLSFPEVTPRASFQDSDIPLCKENFSETVNIVLKDLYTKDLPHDSQITVRRLNGESATWSQLSSTERTQILHHHHRGGSMSLTLGYEGPSFCQPHIPRWTHGLMHATRVGLIVRMVANMYNAYSSIKISEKEIVLAQYLAVFHDSARQAEGVDVWDDESAENAYPYLLELGFTKEVAKECVQIIKDKDSSKPNKHILTKLIQCGDCIDIMRLYGTSGFQNRFLDIFNDLSDNPHFCSDLEAFKSQIHAFIQKTDQGLFRLYQERHSKDYFGDALSLMLSRTEYSLLQKWYGHEKFKAPSKTLQMVFDAPKYTNFGSYYNLKAVYGGTHKAYILADQSGDLYFFKEISKEDADFEALGAQIASEITNGLAPSARRTTLNGKNGILQEYIELENDYALYKPQLLSLDQKIELFSNMIADFVIYNYDTHSLQFGVDEKKQVRGLDKGEAFRPFRTENFSVGAGVDLERFDPNYWPGYYIGTPTYKTFCNYLKSSPEQAQIDKIIHSKKVQEAFQRAKTSPLAYLTKLEQLSKPGTSKRFLERAQKVEKTIKSYFA